MKLFRQICILFVVLLACQSAPPVKKEPTSYLLESKKQGELKLHIPFDDTWKIYLPNDSVAEDHQSIIASLRERILAEPLLFGVSEKFYTQTQYLLNENPNAALKTFVSYLKRTVYNNVNRAKNLGSFETLGGIQGELLQYQIGKVIYFELIYQIHDLFLRTTILTPISNYQNAEEFSVAKDYVMGILNGITFERVIREDNQTVPQETEAQEDDQEALQTEVQENEAPQTEAEFRTQFSE